MDLPLLWLPEALEAEGLTVKRVKGWATRGRNQPFRPQAVMFHHTASAFTWGNAPSLGIVTNGRADLPGPLCNVLMARDLTAYVVAAGRCNHAGFGGPWRNIPENSGNMYMAGVEVENNGINEPWSAELLDACARCFAAFLRHWGRDARWLLGHKEWTDRKIDPSTSMSAARAATAAVLQPPEEGEEDMAIANDYFEALAAKGISAATWALNETFLRAVRLKAQGGYTPTAAEQKDKAFMAGFNWKAV